ncbi:hypothetical protein OS493_008864 [Desmophyllum pertusum]|uniref:ABC transporter domain-containing protein n=1 Tax=Desmophyllum pertusum TaxID=174260 RepID=A0A9W9ZF11_9CNID|nr:hypothetical protein OS493_008864 [Desmophyllum pertusum]
MGLQGLERQRYLIYDRKATTRGHVYINGVGLDRVQDWYAHRLTSLADVVVGGSVGQGLSGGQKRRLCVALQMINLPSVLFLDEPTSAETGNLPLFHKIILLYDGQVAYVWANLPWPRLYFLKLISSQPTEDFRRSKDAPNIDAKNPADTIMDLLNFSQARRAILDYYQASGEPQAVQEAIRTLHEKSQ